MFLSAITNQLRCARDATIALSGLVIASAAGPAIAAGCSFAPQGEGRVVEVIDARTLRLDDGREVNLIGIEPVASNDAETARSAALSAIVAGHEITLHGDDDTPDRYGRQPAFVFLDSADTAEPVSVQAALLAQGAALVAASVPYRDCATTLLAAEAAARAAKRGIWKDPGVIKNTESPGDILAGIGHFMLVEGKVLSVRQAGTTTYLNFGRNWTRDFAVTIPKRMIPVFEGAGIMLKSFENRRIRVRGWIEARGGPRIEVLRVGQIELLGENELAPNRLKQTE